MMKTILKKAMIFLPLLGVFSCVKAPKREEEPPIEEYPVVGDVGYEYVDGKGYFVKALLHSFLTLVLPDDIDDIPVVGIRHEALADQTELMSIRLPEPLEYVEPYAFYSCPKLAYHSYRAGKYLGNEENPYLVLVEETADNPEIHPETRILLDAFSGLSLSDLQIPGTVRYIQYDAFENADRVEYRAYRNGYYLGNKNNPYLVLVKSDDAEIVSIHPKTKFILSAFGNRSKLKEITIPAEVKQIGDYAFHHCDSLKQVLFRGKPDYLGEYAFLNCSSLTSLTLPESILSVPFACFAKCDSLTAIGLPSDLKRIEDYAFYGCASLKNFDFGDGIRRIGFKAFSECGRLSVFQSGSVRYLSSKSNPYFCFFGADDTSDLILDARCRFLIESVPPKVENLAIPESVSYLESHLFEEAESLKKALIPSGIQFIERDAFSEFHPMSLFFEGNPPPVNYLGDWKAMGMSCYSIDENGQFVSI